MEIDLAALKLCRKAGADISKDDHSLRSATSLLLSA
jgi:hypothetical protein